MSHPTLTSRQGAEGAGQIGPQDRLRRQTQATCNQEHVGARVPFAIRPGLWTTRSGPQR